MTFDHEPRADESRIGARLHDLDQIARVVDVVVGDVYPTDLLRLDDREHILEPLLPVRRRPGVDDDRLGAFDDQRVQGDPEWPDASFKKLLQIAFRDRFIKSLDHPVIRALRGELLLVLALGNLARFGLWTVNFQPPPESGQNQFA